MLITWPTPRQVAAILASIEDIDERDRSGQTALHYAATVSEGSAVARAAAAGSGTLWADCNVDVQCGTYNA